MKIVYNHNEPGPVGHVRAWNWAHAMKERGHDVWAAIDASQQITRENADGILKGADIVVCGRTHNAEQFAILLAGRQLYGYKLIVDTDDNTEDVPKYSYGYNDWNVGAATKRLVRGEFREADAVTVSTQQLARIASQYAKRIATIPNVVDMRFHANVVAREKEPRHRGDIRIYWGGGLNHYDDLLVVKDAILSVTAEHANVKLVFSNFIPDWAINALPANRVFMVPMADYQVYPQLLKWLCIDIGIAPLVDNPFNRCKSHIKWLDYSMADIAGVYSDCPAYSTVRDGATGLKCRTTDEWVAALKSLIADRDYRKHISSGAKAKVISEWTLESWIDTYETTLVELTRPAMSIPPVSELIEGEPIQCQIL